MDPKNALSEQPPRAGRSEPFPSGRLTFLSPKPLPTGLPSTDHGRAVGTINDRYLDFGVGLPPVFGWQITLGGPFGLFLLSAVVGPLIALAAGFHFGTKYDAFRVFWQIFDAGFWIGLWAWAFFLLLSLGIWYHQHLKYKTVMPTRFNRQRREVCFVPKGHSEPIFVPWEELVAWVTEAQGVTEYGVQRQYGFGVGFLHPQTGEKYTCLLYTSPSPRDRG